MADSEGTQVQQSTALRVNWLNVNVPTIVALAGVGWGVATYIDDMGDRLEKVEGQATQSEAYRVQRVAQSDKRFDALEVQLDTLNTIPMRVQSVENQIEATNTRLDRLVETLSNNVEMLRKDIAGLTTKVEVLSSKIDTLSPGPPKRAEWTPPRIAK